jgi:hypothetical protein
MPDDAPRKPATPTRRARRFVVRDTDDQRATEKIKEFISGPRARGRIGQRPAPAAGRVDPNFDTRSDFATALAREAARADRYGRPATVVAVEFVLADDRARIGADGASPRTPATIEERAARAARQIDRLAGAIGFTLRREARDTDRIARVAPSRFHVLLPETGEPEANRFIERARRACEVWFAGAAIPAELRIEAASSGRNLSLAQALAELEERMSA